MLYVGLTGGIGSGKSTVARRLRERGAFVIDADAVARDVLGPGTPGLAAVTERFGADLVDSEGALDRAKLASRVFEDAGARADLEAITHPAIRAETARLRESAGPDEIVVHDVPLLVEKRMAPNYHLVVVVDAPATERLRRLTEERGLGEADARARMDHQANDAERREVADVLLDNSGTPEQLDAAIERVWAERIEPYRANLAEQRIHRPSQAPVLVDYDRDWPRQARRLIDRLSDGLGGRAPEIEHVGSTAVPGMPGKDAIDIQVGVSSLTDADDPEFVRILAEMGFPRIEGYRMDHPTDDLPDPSLWIKRFHGSCDPGRVVHLHVREVSSAGWQYALLFRDWLRNDPGAAEEYVEVKALLDAKASSTSEYVKAKEPWFSEVWPRIQSWAQRSGWNG